MGRLVGWVGGWVDERTGRFSIYKLLNILKYQITHNKLITTNIGANKQKYY